MMVAIMKKYFKGKIVKVIIEVNSIFPILGDSCIATHNEAKIMNTDSWRVVKFIC